MARVWEDALAALPGEAYLSWFPSAPAALPPCAWHPKLRLPPNLRRKGLEKLLPLAMPVATWEAIRQLERPTAFFFDAEEREGLRWAVVGGEGEGEGEGEGAAEVDLDAVLPRGAGPLRDLVRAKLQRAADAFRERKGAGEGDEECEEELDWAAVGERAVAIAVAEEERLYDSSKTKELYRNLLAATCRKLRELPAKQGDAGGDAEAEVSGEGDGDGDGGAAGSGAPASGAGPGSEGGAEEEEELDIGVSAERQSLSLHASRERDEVRRRRLVEMRCRHNRRAAARLRQVLGGEKGVFGELAKVLDITGVGLEELPDASKWVDRIKKQQRVMRDMADCGLLSDSDEDDDEEGREEGAGRRRKHNGGRDQKGGGAGGAHAGGKDAGRSARPSKRKRERERGGARSDAGAAEAKGEVEGEAAAEHWSEHRGAEGRTYYFNRRTGETRWTKPSALLSECGKAEQAALAHQGWAKFEGEEGCYYVHEATGASRWDAPFSTAAFEANWAHVMRFVQSGLARRHGGVPRAERAAIAGKATAKVMGRHRASEDGSAAFLRKEGDSIIKLLDKYVKNATFKKRKK